MQNEKRPRPFRRRPKPAKPVLLDGPAELVGLRNQLQETIRALDAIAEWCEGARRTIEPYLPSPEQAAEAPESLSPTPTATLPLPEILTLPDPPSPLQDLYHSALVRGGQTYLGTPPPEQSPKPNE
jgi:hypothetical protein